MTANLRVVTLNIHKGLSQFNRRMVIHDLREGLRALKPDLVFLQEVQGQNEHHARRFPDWPGAPQHEFLAGDELKHVYGRNRVHQYGHYGNAVLSRFPIVSVENEDVSDHRFERRGLLHTVMKVPGWTRNLHCVCVHLSLHEQGRRRQLDAIVARLENLVSRDSPTIVAGDFNDWRQRASRVLEQGLGMQDVFMASSGMHGRTFPSMLPMLRLDRIYVRGFDVLGSQVHRGAPWSLLSDHLAMSAELRRA
ncbi:MAG: endonuclease/exonuclease/phosphatase family protein [Burkholderiales bacterium]